MKMGSEAGMKKKFSTSSFFTRYSSFIIRHTVFLFRRYQHTKVLTIDVLFCCLVLLFLTTPAKAEPTCSDHIIATAPDSSFTIHKDGTVVDNTTGLMWMRCSLGQIWDGTTCSGRATIFPWAAGLKTAESYEFAGYNDWRLPNKNELESIVEGRCFSPAINDEIFPATPVAFFWSSSPYAAISEGAWSVDFEYGTVIATVKSGSMHIRLVRNED